MAKKRKTAEKIKTREPQYERCLLVKKNIGLSTLGLGVNQLWYDDPRHLVFLLSRYKFISKMFSEFKRVLEIGCGDAFGSRLVQQEVKNLTVIDFDAVFIQDAKDRRQARWPLEARVHDILQGPVKETFDGIYALDVLEHIPQKNEEIFFKNAAHSLTKGGVFIVGTPSLESQVYASPPSRVGHVNCKDEKTLRALFLKFFHQVFIFSMNDEVVHTGFYPLAHYFLAVGCGKKY